MEKELKKLNLKLEELEEELEELQQEHEELLADHDQLQIDYDELKEEFEELDLKYKKLMEEMKDEDYDEMKYGKIGEIIPNWLELDEDILRDLIQKNIDKVDSEHGLKK